MAYLRNKVEFAYVSTYSDIGSFVIQLGSAINCLIFLFLELYKYKLYNTINSSIPGALVSRVTYSGGMVGNACSRSTHMRKGDV